MAYNEDLFAKVGVQVKNPDGTDRDGWDIFDDLIIAWQKTTRPKKKWWQFWRKY